MTDTPAQSAVDIASAFSGHRFADAYAGLSEHVRWVAFGVATTIGRDAVIDLCETTLRELADTRTEFLRFLVIDGGEAVAVDSVARYVEGSGATTTVASCDVYEFRQGQVTTITSYTVLLDPEPDDSSAAA
jgi:ketosteroid isomerase-like protein